MMRRLGLAAFSLAIAAVLFRGNVASALVTRGDDAMRSGDADNAVRYYGRSLLLDPSFVLASDRLAFVLLMRRHTGDAQRAYTVAEVALRAVPDDPALHVDRALAAMRLGDARVAERDFAAAARTGHDPRYAHLAAHMAVRRGDRAAEHRYLRTALRWDASYAPARALLVKAPR